MLAFVAVQPGGGAAWRSGSDNDALLRLHVRLMPSPRPRRQALTPQRAFRVASCLAMATTVLMAGLIVLGSIVRTTGSGLACPDWPLCEGRLIPRFELHVMIEWGHRLVALLVSVLLLATLGWTLVNPPLRRRLGGLVTLAVALLFVQILLGALTVWKLLSPTVVSGHLAVALLLFATLLV